MGTHEPGIVSVTIASPIGRSDLPGLLARVCELLERSGAKVALCDVSDAPADALTVDALARLQLVARRKGCQIRLSHASSELLALLAFTGLKDVLLD
jgi:ABC-type transporter Mla MlaB component